MNMSCTADVVRVAREVLSHFSSNQTSSYVYTHTEVTSSSTVHVATTHQSVSSCRQLDMSVNQRNPNYKNGPPSA